MTDWKALIENFFANSDPEGTFARLTPPGCDDKAIDHAESEIGLQFPPELREFYQHYDGIGLGDETIDIPRFIPSIAILPQFVADARSSISSTHQDIATRYLPFIDWGNGDSSGYLYNQDGSLFEFVVVFSHEHYNAVCDQDVGEFLMPFAESLSEMLGQGMS